MSVEPVSESLSRSEDMKDIEFVGDIVSPPLHRLLAAAPISVQVRHKREFKPAEKKSIT